MPTPTHTGPIQPDASYDDRGHFTAAPTALAGSIRLVADAQRVVELPAQRRLVPELRRESQAAPRPHEWPTFMARRGARPQFSFADLPYVGVHQPNDETATTAVTVLRNAVSRGLVGAVVTSTPLTVVGWGC